MSLPDGLYTGVVIDHTGTPGAPVQDPSYTIRVRLRNGETNDIPGIKPHPWRWDAVGIDEMPSAMITATKNEPIPVIVINSVIYAIFMPPPAVGCQ